MNLDAVQTFVLVVQHRTFAAAARARRLAPSSVSRTVGDLEDELGIRLFHRTTRTLSLTEAGERYLAQVAPLLEEFERAQNEARDMATKPRGLIRVAVPRPFAQMYFRQWLLRFLEAESGIEVELVLETRYTDLVAERIDVAIRLGQVRSLGLVAKKLCDMPRVVVASPARVAGASLKPEAMAREPCLVFPHEAFTGAWKFRDGRGFVREVRPKARVTAADGIFLRDLAVAGAGFALIPRWLCAEELAKGTLIDVFARYDVTATEFDGAVWLVYPSRAYVPLKVRVFVDFIASLFKKGPPWERPVR
jgi:DNA-binding transcriptional LysR family regulator